MASLDQPLLFNEHFNVPILTLNGASIDSYKNIVFHRNKEISKPCTRKYIAAILDLARVELANNFENSQYFDFYPIFRFLKIHLKF